MMHVNKQRIFKDESDKINSDKKYRSPILSDKICVALFYLTLYAAALFNLIINAVALFNLIIYAVAPFNLIIYAVALYNDNICRSSI